MGVMGAVYAAGAVQLPDVDSVRQLHGQAVLVHAHALDEVAALDADL